MILTARISNDTLANTEILSNLAINNATNPVHIMLTTNTKLIEAEPVNQEKERERNREWNMQALERMVKHMAKRC